MLEIKNCSYSYKQGNTILNNINLTIETGSFFGLLGENGAGKTTLIHLIASILKLQQGSITINNTSIISNTLKYKSQLGWVPQEFNFNAFQTLEQMLINSAGFYGISKKQALPRMQFLMESLDLWHRRKMRIRQLSGGLKRRLMIVRSLITKPSILLLDEPTAGVDVAMRKKTWEFLNHLNQTEKTTIILTSHYLEEIEKLCNQVAVLHKGNIIKSGKLNNLLNDCAQETTFIQLQNDLPNDINLKNVVSYDKKILAVEIKQQDDLHAIIKNLLQKNIKINRIWSEQTKLATLLNKWIQE